MKALVALVVILAAYGGSGFAVETAHVTSATATVGPQPTLTLSLDGENWLLDTDPRTWAAGTVVQRPDEGGETDPSAMDHSRGVSGLSRRRLVLARF